MDAFWDHPCKFWGESPFVGRDLQWSILLLILAIISVGMTAYSSPPLLHCYIFAFFLFFIDCHLFFRPAVIEIAFTSHSHQFNSSPTGPATESSYNSVSIISIMYFRLFYFCCNSPFQKSNCNSSSKTSDTASRALLMKGMIRLWQRPMQVPPRYSLSVRTFLWKPFCATMKQAASGANILPSDRKWLNTI